jgi:hypothetical protein
VQPPGGGDARARLRPVHGRPTCCPLHGDRARRHQARRWSAPVPVREHTDDEDVRADEALADYFSFAQLDGLLVTGSGTAGHDADIDRLEDDTVKRVDEH